MITNERLYGPGYNPRPPDGIQASVWDRMSWMAKEKYLARTGRTQPAAHPTRSEVLDDWNQYMERNRVANRAYWHKQGQMTYRARIINEMQ